jgi:hypothetical protein
MRAIVWQSIPLSLILPYLEGQLKLRDAEIEELRARMNLYQEERG